MNNTVRHSIQCDTLYSHISSNGTATVDNNCSLQISRQVGAGAESSKVSLAAHMSTEGGKLVMYGLVAVDEWCREISGVNYFESVLQERAACA